MITLIKASPTPGEAKIGLTERAWEPGSVKAMLTRVGGDACRPENLPEGLGFSEAGYFLSPDQAQAILELRLHRLTALEQDKLLNEFDQLLDIIQALLEILNSPGRLMEVIREELIVVRRLWLHNRI